MVELAINEVHEDGRNSYKRKYRENVSQQDFYFNVVEHETATLAGEVLFEKMEMEGRRRKLNAFLISSSAIVTMNTIWVQHFCKNRNSWMRIYSVA